VATAWLAVKAARKPPTGAKAPSIATPSNVKSARRGRSGVGVREEPQSVGDNIEQAPKFSGAPARSLLRAMPPTPLLWINVRQGHMLRSAQRDQAP
jgi:hypothetical protein